jgi:hypothetical protein
MSRPLAGGSPLCSSSTWSREGGLTFAAPRCRVETQHVVYAPVGSVSASHGVLQLLAALQAMFAKNRTQITSEQVVQELLADPDSQWHEYRVCAFLATRAEHPNTQAWGRRKDVKVSGCSDDWR